MQQKRHEEEGQRQLFDAIASVYAAHYGVYFLSVPLSPVETLLIRRVDGDSHGHFWIWLTFSALRINIFLVVSIHPRRSL